MLPGKFVSAYENGIEANNTAHFSNNPTMKETIKATGARSISGRKERTARIIIKYISGAKMIEATMFEKGENRLNPPNTQTITGAVNPVAKNPVSTPPCIYL